MLVMSDPRAALPTAIYCGGRAGNTRCVDCSLCRKKRIENFRYVYCLKKQNYLSIISTRENVKPTNSISHRLWICGEIIRPYLAARDFIHRLFGGVKKRVLILGQCVYDPKIMAMSC